MLSTKLPTVEVVVRVIGDYGDAREYRDPDPGFGYDGYFGDRAACKARSYIESKDGMEYEVVVRVMDDPSIEEHIYDDQGLQFHLFIDGEHMGRRFAQYSNFRHHNGKSSWGTTFLGRKRPVAYSYGKKEIRRFVFTPMSIVDDSASTAQLNRARALGTIEVVVRKAEFAGMSWFRSERGPTSRLTQTPYQTESSWGSDELPEEALKGRALTHSTGFTEPEYTSVDQSNNRASRVDSSVTDNGHPVASYLFKYRSLDGLKRESVIPRTPPPDYTIEKPQIAELSQHELERLARQRINDIKETHQRQRQAECVTGQADRSGKRGFSETGLNDAAGLGDEPVTKKARQYPEIVDLTGEDEEMSGVDAAFDMGY